MESNRQYETEWIHKLEKEVSWRSYWLQQRVLDNELTKNDTILEIGKGTGFCSNYLKSRGYNVTTIDIDEAKKPDIVGNIVDYEFNEKFDYVIAFEVFEHIPFENLSPVFNKLKSCVGKKLIMSIPEGTLLLFLADIRLPIIKHVRFGIKLQQRYLPSFLRLKLSKYHHWELNYKNEYSIKKIKELLNEEGLTIESHIKSHFNNHNFFVINPK